MRDMLEPTFGESGAVVAQFFIAVIALLILVGLVYWVFRRFGGLRFGGIGRGRIPRLAITDALSIGSRHKLVLVRREQLLERAAVVVRVAVREHDALDLRRSERDISIPINQKMNAEHREHRSGGPRR